MGEFFSFMYTLFEQNYFLNIESFYSDFFRTLVTQSYIYYHIQKKLVFWNFYRILINIQFKGYKKVLSLI